MNKILLKISILLSSFLGYSQFNFNDPVAVGDTGVSPRYVVVGDVNNDNLDDVLVSTRINDTDGGGKLELFISSFNTTGTFTKVTVNNSLEDVFKAALADINGDGFLDIVAAGAANATVAWYPNDGSGNFPSESIINSTLSGPTTVVVGDIDNNETLDVAVAAYGEASAYWFSNTDGNGTFSSPNLIGSMAGGGAFDLDLGDFDGDGDLDAVVAYEITEAVQVYDNRLISSGTASFSNFENTVTNESQDLYDVLFADVDNDGSLEIVVADYGNTVTSSTGDLLYFERNDNTTATTFTRIAINEAAPERMGTVVVEDFTEDGLNDVVYVSAVIGSVYGYAGTAAGNLGARELIGDLPNASFGIDTGDFDGDGVMDIAIADHNAGQLYVIINGATLSLSDQTLTGLRYFPNPVKDNLTVKGIIQENEEFTILNYLGQKVLDVVLDLENKIDMSSLQSGMYLLKFQTSGKLIKFIKQ